MARSRLFDESTLAEAGLAVAERAGWPAVSTRSVARELGVSAMALYRLAPDAENLRRLIANAASDAIQPSNEAASLMATLRAWALSAHFHLGRYPGLPAYLLLQWTELPGWLDIVERLLAIAADEGLSGVGAVAKVNAIFTYVLARAQVRDGIAGAPSRELAPLHADPGRYRYVGENRPEFMTAQTDKHFLFGVESLLIGMRTPVVERE